MVDQQVIGKRLEKMEQSLRKIDRFKHLTWEEFNQDDLVQDVVEYNLLIAINLMVDIAAHVVVDAKMGVPDTLAESFHFLYQNKHISEEQYQLFRRMTAFRNKLTHEYLTIDTKVVYRIMQDHIQDFRQFILLIHDKFFEKE